jgi:curved DNA-binding protein CbpA
VGGKVYVPLPCLLFRYPNGSVSSLGPVTERTHFDNSGPLRRRSTRVQQAMPLTVSGTDALNNTFEEQTGTVSINCHGCRFFSRHHLVKDDWLAIEIPALNTQDIAQNLQARVAWAEKSGWMKEMFQVGVEFETPGNVWGLADPPEDWQRYTSQAGADAAFGKDLEQLLHLAKTGTYYQLLGSTADSSRAQVRHNFYELARKFHPDLHQARPELFRSLQETMDALTLAYKTLTNDASREDYDRRLAASSSLQLGLEKTERRKTADECLAKAKECLAAQNYVGSITWLRKGAEMEPNNSKCHAMLARSLGVVPQYRREAIQHFEQALELDPMNVWAHVQFGLLYEAMNLPWRSRPHYEEALAIDPDDRAARKRLDALDAAQDSQQPGKSRLRRVFSRTPK